jgi:hypothetical protein
MYLYTNKTYHFSSSFQHCILPRDLIMIDENNDDGVDNDDDDDDYNGDNYDG